MFLVIFMSKKVIRIGVFVWSLTDIITAKYLAYV